MRVREGTEITTSCFCLFVAPDCANEFSAHQVARMHCYIDLVYRTWLVNNGQQRQQATPIPLQPQVMRAVRNANITEITLVQFI